MTENFDRALRVLFGEEGGLSMDTHDPGNWTSGKPGAGVLKGTKYGISAASFPDVDIAGLTPDKAKAIYLPKYWQPAGCDKLPWPLCLFVFDAAVNQGVDAAVRLLQRVAGVPQDGVPGPQTLQRAARLGQFGLAEFMAERALRYASSQNFDRYGRAWFVRLFDVTMKGTEQ